MLKKANITRKTGETDIQIELTPYGSSNRQILTGIGFFDHMLDLFCKHGFWDAKIVCKGDIYVDAHHSIEDVGISLGKCLALVLEDKQGLARFGSCALPMDETLAEVALDISGRPFLVYNVPMIQTGALVGNVDAQLFEEFFRAVSDNAGITLHINVRYGKNIHHIIEAIFKGFGRALAQACAQDTRVLGIPSTKGVL